jgi:DNA-directed RNA polymerase subunit RPC12/RpoP
MAASPSKKQTFLCPGCGAKFEFGAKMAGRSGKCQRCGHLFTVPISAPANEKKAPPKPAKPAAAAPQPEFVGVTCRVCQTRLFGRLNQVGQPLKCPDCGAETILKAPIPEKPKSLPAALEGEQYELWDVDAAPRPEELRAAQPKYIPIHCRVCGTLMHATESQIGKQLTCPDCSTRTLVVEPAAQKAPRDVLVSDADAYQLDEAFAPTERPATIQVEYKGMLYEQEREAELAREAADKASGKKPRQRTDVHGRAIMPRWPLLTDVLPFMFSPGLLARWMAMSAALLITSITLAEGVIAWRTSPDPRLIFAGLTGTLFGAVGLLLWFAAFSGMLVAIVSESSEGHDRVHGWPPANFIESMPELFCVLIAASLGAAPGFAIGQWLTSITWQQAAATAASFWLLFPFVFLSQLAASSPWAILSWRLIGAAFRRPFSTLLFYAESALLFLIVLLPIAPVAAIRPSLPVLLAPLYVAGLFLYGRLLGRWGWVLAETFRARETDDAA